MDEFNAQAIFEGCTNPRNLQHYAKSIAEALSLMALSVAAGDASPDEVIKVSISLALAAQGVSQRMIAPEMRPYLPSEN